MNNDKINSIRYYTFENCNNLKSIIIPENVKDVELYSFNNSAIEKIDTKNNGMGINHAIVYYGIKTNAVF